MATILTLFCLAIDNQKEVIGNIFNVKIQSDDYASDLKDAIKAKMANQLSHVDADQLIIWKLLKLQCIDLATNKISDAIKVFDFSSSETVQVLHSGNELSQYWENSPDEGHLHIVVQVPSVERPESKQSINIDLVRGTADHLYHTLWKKPLNPILATIDVPDPKKSYMYVPQDQLSNLGVQHLGYNEKALLFRYEYSLAREEIEKKSKERRENSRGGIIITGDPGLGKTCFLLYLLFYRLSKGLPTAFQFLPDSFVLFKESGVEFYAHTFGVLPDETWAFTKDRLPCHSFLRACGLKDAFVVQTSYPDEHRYKTWRKEYNAYTYVMDCFPLTELVALGMIHGFSVKLIKDHWEKWGPSARIMMTLMTKPERIRNHTQHVKDAAVHFVDSFDYYITKVNPMAISHTLFTIRPKGLSSEDRPSSIGRIETSYLNRFLIEAIAAKKTREQINSYYRVSSH